MVNFFYDNDKADMATIKSDFKWGTYYLIA